MKDKKPKTLSNKEKKPLTDSDISNLERKFDFGKGVSLTIESGNAKTAKNDVSYHYSNKLEKLDVKGSQLTVAVSSIEAENEEILHFLLKKSRE